MYVCVYVCLSVCMYIYIYIYIAEPVFGLRLAGSGAGGGARPGKVLKCQKKVLKIWK